MVSWSAYYFLIEKMTLDSVWCPGQLIICLQKMTLDSVLASVVRTDAAFHSLSRHFSLSL